MSNTHNPSRSNANCEAPNNTLSEYEQRMEAIVDQIRGCDSSLKAIGILSREMQAESVAFAEWCARKYISCGKNVWIAQSPIDYKEYTTDQLYELYKQKP